MSELFLSGFEETSVVADLSIATWGLQAGATALSTSIKHSGGQSLKIFPGSNVATNVSRGLTPVTANALFTRFYFYPVTAGTAIDPTIFEEVSNGNLQSLMIRFMRTGALRLENVLSGHTETTSTILTLNTFWYRVETKHVVADSGGSMELRLFLGDSTTALETLNTQITSEDTKATNVTTLFFGQRTNPSTTCTFYLDDIKVNNDQGSASTDWPGPGKTQCITVVSNNSTTWTSSAGGASDFLNIDETPTGIPNDATDYNLDTSATHEDRFNINTLSSEVPSTATLKTLSLWTRCRESATGSTQRFVTRIWNESGTGTDGTFTNLTSTSWRSSSTDEHQSYDLTGKTKNDLSSFSVGYRSTVGTVTEKQISALYANVEWIESPGQTLVVDSGSYLTTGISTLLRLTGLLYLRLRK